MAALRQVSLAVVVATLATSGRAGAQDSALAARLDAYTAPLASAGHLSGTLLVARRGETIYRRTWGTIGAGRTTPLTAEMPVNVASLTKPLTVIIATRLVEAGRLRLDDPVARWLPGFPNGEAMTVDQLLRHRAGVPHRVTAPDDETRRRTAADMVRLAAAATPDFPPGTDRRYSSGGYAVVAAVLERAAGRSYAQLLEEFVARPVGATHTHDATGGPPPPGVRGQYLAPDAPVAAPAKDLSFLVGAGSVSSTADDLRRITRGLLRGTYGEAARDRLTDSAGGLAWNGVTSGHRAWLDHDAGTGVTIILVANLVSGANDLLRRDVPRLVRGEAVPAPTVPSPAVVPATPAVRAAAEGSYRLGAPQDLRFDSPTLARLGEWLLWPTGGDTFYSPQDYSPLLLERDAAGAVTAIQWGEAGQGPRFPRLGP